MNQDIGAAYLGIALNGGAWDCENGCPFKGLLGDRGDHLKVCALRPYKCPFCDWEGSDLIDHMNGLDGLHAGERVQGWVFNRGVEISFGVSGKYDEPMWYGQVDVSDEDHLFLYAAADNDSAMLKFALVSWKPGLKGKWSITFKSEGDSHRYESDGVPGTQDVRPQDLIEKGSCLSVPYGALARGGVRYTGAVRDTKVATIFKDLEKLVFFLDVKI
jgi:hypothetical protein